MNTNYGEIVGNIFNIQRYSIHDGPGIRTTVFVKGCPLRCFWCQNPESWSRQVELLWNRGLCTNCGRCVKVCRYGALSFSEGLVVMDRGKCTKCGDCVGACFNKARSIKGYTITAQKTLEEVLKDRRLYSKSGGGVTISGGEATAQPEFTTAVLRLCKENWIHTAIETCGQRDWETLKGILEYTDYVLYDIKCVDDEKHKRGTGVSNGLILSNAAKIAAWKPVLFRMPLIPGYNDNEEDVLKFRKLVRDDFGLGSESMELLKYNPMGEEKYRHLDRPEDEIPSYQAQSQEQMDRLEELLH